MQFKPRSTRTIALLTAGVIAASTFIHAAPAQAADKSKSFKYGAIGLGVVGAYLLSKGKTAPGAAVVAGGLYAYKKGRNHQDEEDWKHDGHYTPGHGQDGYNGHGNDNHGYGSNGYNNSGYNGGGYTSGGNYGGYDRDDHGYGNGNGGYQPDYRANAQYRDNHGNDNHGNDNHGNGNRDNGNRDNRNDADCRQDNRLDNGRRDDRNENRRDNRRSDKRDNRQDNRGGQYDLSPYLR